jgi:hypothetical protein
VRKLRGWIINLADALGPPPGSVEVHAYLNDDDDPGDLGGNLSLATHDLGSLTVVHQAGPGGSGSPTEANAEGHFGWDMEFNPGPITTRIKATDPQPDQYRARFPDESAQIGKAFHSDLERLGWTAGRDCLIWGAIEGVAQPTPAEWGTTPLTSSDSGDWGVLTSGTGVTPGRVLLKRGIGFLGGVVFSIEAADLVVPVPGEEAGVANPGITDRWDLLVAVMHNDPGAPTTYGKQRIVIQQGPADGKIPALTPVAGQRRMALHALKMAAGGTGYSEATDLRPWQPGSPAGLFNPITQSFIFPALQATTEAGIASGLNTELASHEVVLPLGSRWIGQANWHATVIGGNPLFFGIQLFSEAYDAAGTLVTGTDYVQRPPSGHDLWSSAGSVEVPHSTSWPIQTIPKFQADALATNTRSWTRLRFRIILFGLGVGSLRVKDQHINIHLWPVP